MIADATDWLNNKAVMFLPSWGRQVEWESVLDDPDVSIAIAPLDALLAMKLNAARPGRDTEDIAKLPALNEIDSVGSAELLFESFYPGDALPERTIDLLDRISFGYSRRVSTQTRTQTPVGSPFRQQN